MLYLAVSYTSLLLGKGSFNPRKKREFHFYIMDIDMILESLMNLDSSPMRAGWGWIHFYYLLVP